MNRSVRMIALALIAGLATGPAVAGQTNVAVASNFTDAAKDIAVAFKAKTGDDAVLSFGSTGQFFAQIGQGAPFQVFLAADGERPQKLVEDGLAVAGSRFTYAVGRVSLWSADPNLVKGEETLRGGGFSKLAIANPAGAPYGAAAIAVLKSLGLYDALETKIVQGNNIAQTFQFVETGNAELGFVALSQIAGIDRGSRWDVPQALYAPIRQDAVLLKTGGTDDTARAFIDFLKGPEARAIIEKHGYGTPADS